MYKYITIIYIYIYNIYIAKYCGYWRKVLKSLAPYGLDTLM